MRSNRRGFTLIDGLLGVLVLAILGVAVFEELGSTTCNTRSLRADFWLRQLTMDLLDRQVAGEARSLLTQGPAGGVFARELDAEDWRALLPAAALDLIWPLHPQISLELTLPERPEPGQRIRFGIVTCSIQWTDPARGARSWRIAGLTDAL